MMRVRATNLTMDKKVRSLALQLTLQEFRIRTMSGLERVKKAFDLHAGTI